MDLKNLTFSSWLKDSWQVYWSNLQKVWKVYAFLFIPIAFLSFLEEFNTIIQSGAGTMVFVVAFAAVLIFMLLLSIAMITQIQNVIEGKDDSVQGLLTVATPIFWPYVLTYLLSSVLILMGFILLIIPGIILSIYWAFVEQTVILRNKSYMGALDYSYALVQDRWWRVLLYLTGLGLVGALFTALPDLLLSPLGIPARLLALAISAIFTPWLMIAEVMFFLHLEKTRAPGSADVPRLLRPMKKARSAKKKTSAKSSRRKAR